MSIHRHAVWLTSVADIESSLSDERSMYTINVELAVIVEQKSSGGQASSSELKRESI